MTHTVRAKHCVSVCAVIWPAACDRQRQISQAKHAAERYVDLADGDGIVDQEVAVLYTAELTNCLWAEKAEHREMW